MARIESKIKQKQVASVNVKIPAPTKTRALQMHSDTVEDGLPLDEPGR
jgi:hypothetical protein